MISGGGNRETGKVLGRGNESRREMDGFASDVTRSAGTTGGHAVGITRSLHCTVVGIFQLSNLVNNAASYCTPAAFPFITRAVSKEAESTIQKGAEDAAPGGDETSSFARCGPAAPRAKGAGRRQRRLGASWKSGAPPG
jgi:hypothetical protein